MSRPSSQTRHVTVYLLKPEYDNYSSCLKDAIGGRDVPVDGRSIGRLYSRDSEDRVPVWYRLFEDALSDAEAEPPHSKNAAALFLVKCQGRIFGFTFGYGRSLLKPDSWEPRFGLKVVLNSVSRDRIRVVDRKEIDTMLTHTRTQSSRECSIDEFNFDPQRVLVKAITGVPTDEKLAKSATGADGLSMQCELTLGGIEAKCERLLEISQAQAYKDTFGWVDNLSEIKSHVLIAHLNDEALRLIRDQDWDHVFLAVPEVVDWVKIDGFKYRDDETSSSPDISLVDFLETTGQTRPLSIDTLKNRHVFQVWADTSAVVSSWSVYKCLNCEVDLEDKRYILTDGRWFEMDPDFVKSTDNNMAKVTRSTITLEAMLHEKEPAYLTRLGLADAPANALVHGNPIRYGGGRSQIEPCDIFTIDRRLIHVKRYSGSSVLSHLFAQGEVSAAIFRRDKQFRESLNAILPQTHRIDLETEFKSSDYQVVFGIISKTADQIPDCLPFFSKISLWNAVERIHDDLGFLVSVAGIKIAT